MRTTPDHDIHIALLGANVAVMGIVLYLLNPAAGWPIGSLVVPVAAGLIALLVSRRARRRRFLIAAWIVMAFIALGTWTQHKDAAQSRATPSVMSQWGV